MVWQGKTNELLNNLCQETMSNIIRWMEKGPLQCVCENGTENTVQLLDHYLGMRAGFSFQAVISCYAWRFSSRKTKSCKPRVIFTSLKKEGHLILCHHEIMISGNSLTNMISVRNLFLKSC